MLCGAEGVVERERLGMSCMRGFERGSREGSAIKQWIIHAEGVTWKLEMDKPRNRLVGM